MTKMNIKALVLLSGGLDSMLAAKVLMEQGIEVTGLSFKSYFFKTDKAKKVAEQLGVKLIEVDFSYEHLKMVKNPAHGYGKNINPCIDCHGLMLKKAGEILRGGSVGATLAVAQNRAGASPAPTKDKYDFVATGEVLGERPMSQNKDSLKLVEKISGLQGKLLRPLSAKLLDETEVEREGKINRDKLLDISGRSRQRQLELVKKYKIKEYANPAGGCLLTDREFSNRLKKMIDYWSDCDINDIDLLKNGRIYWLTLKTPENAKGDQDGIKILVVIGRDKKNNEQLEKLARNEDVLMELVDEVGPITLLRSKKLPARFALRSKAGGEVTTAKAGQGGKNKNYEIQVPKELEISKLELDQFKNVDGIINFALMLTGYYATKTRGKKIKININIIK